MLASIVTLTNIRSKQYHHKFLVTFVKSIFSILYFAELISLASKGHCKSKETIRTRPRRYPPRVCFQRITPVATEIVVSSEN